MDPKEERLECTADNTCQDAEPWDGTERRGRSDEMAQGRDTKMLDTPFWRVMAFVFTGLVAIAVWVMKANIERIDKINENQIEMKTLLKVLTYQTTKSDEKIESIRRDVEALKLSDRTQQEQLESLAGRRVK